MNDPHNMETSAPSIDLLVARTTDLVPMPAVYFEVKRIIDDPDSSIIDLARTIALDPALTAHLLRIVNSSLYAQSRPVETVSRAVNMLGTQQIHDLVLATSLGGAFSQFQPFPFDMHAFWRSSVHRAMLAKAMAMRIGLRDNERLFVLGLLSDLGLLVLWLNVPEIARQASDLAQQRGDRRLATEPALLGFDHAQLGGALLAAWKLPPGLHRPIVAQGLGQAEQAFAIEAAWLHLVGSMVEATERDLDPLIWIDPAAWTLTQITPEIATETLAEVAGEVDHIHALFFPYQGTR